MGLMGSSLALALRQRVPNIRIGGVVRSQKSADYLRSFTVENKKIADEVIVCPRIEEARNLPYRNYELIVFGIPIQQLMSLFSHLPAVDSLITDMSSAQSALYSAVQERPDLRFVHSHPLCGSEENGPQAAKQCLFQNRLCLISAHPKHAAEVPLIEKFWQSLQMQTCITSVQEHDQAVAYLSHTPHLLSGLLCLWALQEKTISALQSKSPLPLAGGGMQDMVRTAGSNPEMWADILKANKKNILSSLQKYEKEVSQLIQSLKEKEPSWWLSWFQDARKAREKLCRLI